MPKRSRAEVEFDSAKAAAYSDLADLIGEHGYEPTVAACAELVERRVTDEMRAQFVDRWEDDDAD